MVSFRNANYDFLLAVILILCAGAANVIAQTQRDESQTAPTTGTITGRVINEAGQPLANASITLRGSQAMFQPRTTMTDSEGNFQVSGLEPLLYGIIASAPAYVTPPRDPDSQPNYYRIGDSVTVNLVKGGVITGAVMSATGEPVVQIGVKAVMVRDASGQPPRYAAFQIQRATDDRGQYRIYGLLPGTYVVSTTSRGLFNSVMDAFDTNAPTYAPSSTRDTAAEVIVTAGEETSGVDIRYRAEPGRTVSGFVSGVLDSSSNIPGNITLVQVANGSPTTSAFAFQPPGSKGFAFYGVADGEYDLVAQSSAMPGDFAVSEPRHLNVKGADITGIELVVKSLASISGRLILEKSQLEECKNKRQPLFSETLITARRNDKVAPKDQPRFINFFASQGVPVRDGDFLMRNLAPGQYNLGTRFFAKYWYLRSISRETVGASPAVAKPGVVKRQTDLARDGLNLKFGDRPKDVIFTLSEGAASLRGAIKLAANGAVPPKLYVHLVPAEKESVDDVLRFFAAEVHSDGTFALNNLPPGQYWIVARVAGANESQLDIKVRSPGETEIRTQLRKIAEAAKTEIEFKPCQNVTGYALNYH